MIKGYLQELKKNICSEITEVPEVFKPSHFPGLDGLRAISIIIVLLGHSLIGTWWVKYLPGSIGVDIFFVISGFLITTLLLKEKLKNGTVILSNFYMRRILRIFPVAYLYLLTLVMLNYVFKLQTTVRMFLCAGLYIDNFPIQYGKNWYTSHFWSLAVEEQFYLLFPILIVKKLNLYVWVIIVILLSLPFFVLLGHTDLNAYYNHELFHKGVLSLTYLLGYGTSSILIGSLSSILIFKGIIKIKEKYSYYLTTILFVTLLIIRAITSSNVVLTNNYFGFFILSYLYAILIAIIITINLKSNLFSNFLNNTYLIKIGVLSYSIYIWQELFTYDQPWRNSFKYGSSIILNMFMLFLISYFSYFFYEKKFLQLKKRFIY